MSNGPHERSGSKGAAVLNPPPGRLEQLGDQLLARDSLSREPPRSRSHAASRRRAFCTDGSAPFARANGRARTSTLAGLAAIVIASPVAGLRPGRFFCAGFTRTVSCTSPPIRTFDQSLGRDIRSRARGRRRRSRHRCGSRQARRHRHHHAHQTTTAQAGHKRPLDSVPDATPSVGLGFGRSVLPQTTPARSATGRRARLPTPTKRSPQHQCEPRGRRAVRTGARPGHRATRRPCRARQSRCAARRMTAPARRRAAGPDRGAEPAHDSFECGSYFRTAHSWRALRA
jgi:hypothetical protein